MSWSRLPVGHSTLSCFCFAGLPWDRAGSCLAPASEEQPVTETAAASQLLGARSKRRSEDSSHKGNRVALRSPIVLTGHFNLP